MKNYAGLIATLLLTIAGCKSIEFQSRWAAQPPPSDGKRGAAWDSVLVKVEDRNLLVGFLNDSNYLYLSFITDDRMLQRQILNRGFTLWLDKNGGDDKKFGFQYPIESATPRFSQGGGNPEGGDGGSEDRPGGYAAERPRFDETEIEMYGPMEGEHSRMSVTSLKDMSVRIGFDGAAMVYTAKIPFRDRGANPYAIGIGEGSKIGVGIETASGARGGGGGRGEGGDGGMAPPGSGDRGGRGGFGGGGRGGRGGGGRGRRPGGVQMEPLDIWCTVQLAVK
jgi:hypothetical protein